MQNETFEKRSKVKEGQENSAAHIYDDTNGFGTRVTIHSQSRSLHYCQRKLIHERIEWKEKKKDKRRIL